jgi:hypothetical protein
MWEKIRNYPLSIIWWILVLVFCGVAMHAVKLFTMEWWWKLVAVGLLIFFAVWLTWVGFLLTWTMKLHQQWRLSPLHRLTIKTIPSIFMLWQGIRVLIRQQEHRSSFMAENVVSAQSMQTLWTIGWSLCVLGWVWLAWGVYTYRTTNPHTHSGATKKGKPWLWYSMSIIGLLIVLWIASIIIPS